MVKYYSRNGLSIDKKKILYALVASELEFIPEFLRLTFWHKLRIERDAFLVTFGLSLFFYFLLDTSIVHG